MATLLQRPEELGEQLFHDAWLPSGASWTLDAMKNSKSFKLVDITCILTGGYPLNKDKGNQKLH